MGASGEYTQHRDERRIVRQGFERILLREVADKIDRDPACLSGCQYFLNPGLFSQLLRGKSVSGGGESEKGIYICEVKKTMIQCVVWGSGWPAFDSYTGELLGEQKL